MELEVTKAQDPVFAGEVSHFHDSRFRKLEADFRSQRLERGETAGTN
jgi:hypothetical protein